MNLNIRNHFKGIYFSVTSENDSQIKIEHIIFSLASK